MGTVNGCFHEVIKEIVQRRVWKNPMIVTQEKQSDNSSSGARSTNRNIPNIPNLSFKIVDLLKDPESHMDPMALWSNIPTPRDPPGLSFNGSNIAVDVATEGAGSAGRLGVSGSSDPN